MEKASGCQITGFPLDYAETLFLPLQTQAVKLRFIRNPNADLSELY